ncbi:MAG: HNH endonuclease signature motif containing protein [Dehalococcoidia bacterium]
MSFSPIVAEQALVACGRHCCLCHNFCGTKIELHHITQQADEGEDTFDNCIPLCLNCHAEVKAYNPHHPKGRQFTETELKAHRDNWYQQVIKSGGIITRPEYTEMDRKLFDKIRTTLSSDDAIRFLRNNNYAGFSFERSKHYQLYEFMHKCVNPEFEFIDADLESLKVQLLGKINEFTNVISLNTFTVEGNTEYSWVIPDWEFEQPERFWEIVNNLHSLAQDICDTYDNLIRLGRRKLGVS